MKVKFDLVKNKKVILGLLAAAVVICFGAVLFRGLNFGIDFKGGTIAQFNLHTPFETEEIRQITDAYDPQISITSAGENAESVVLSSGINFSEAEKASMFSEFKEKYGLSDDDLLSFTAISPSVGADLQRQSLIASLITVVCILIYISFRFEYQFGIAAIAALVHDLMVVIGIYAIFQFPVNSSFIASLLTILGYSINNTIVVFDRIRENRSKYPTAKYDELLNDSINATFSRSLNTTLTTLLAVCAIYFIGVDSIKQFMLPLIVGFIAGLYSSVFIAGLLWYMMTYNKAGKLRAKPANAKRK